MSLSITQHPAYLNLSQSPVVFVVKESSNSLLAESTFQYNMKLYYWVGDIGDIPTEENYILVKYKNTSGYGIFDLSKILNSLFTESLINNTSNVYYFMGVFYTSYYNGSTWINGSTITSDVYKSIDGYKIFNDDLDAEISGLTEFYPNMTDGPATQYYYENDVEVYLPVFSGILDHNNVNPFSYPARYIYSIQLSSSWTPSWLNYLSAIAGGTGAFFNLTNYGSYSTDEMVQYIPISPACPNFPSLDLQNRNFYIQALSSGDGFIGSPIKFEYKCSGKYDNIVLKWKNRYGQFDNFNFNLVSSKSFNSDNLTFTKQIGDWEGTTFNYDKSAHSKQVYGSSQTQYITVNSDFIDEEYNAIFQQMIVSDEIYWVYDGRNIPLILDSTNFQMKSLKVDKLINYTFTFQYSQPYKIII